MSIGDTPQDSELFMQALREKANSLHESLAKEDLDRASALIKEITRNRDEYIFQSVGKLTRALHNSIKTFNVDADNYQQSITSTSTLVDGKGGAGQESSDPASDIQDASNRLSYVIELTEKAADKTMDKVEAAMPLAKGMGDEARGLQAEWQRFGRREMPLTEFKGFYDRLNNHFSNIDANTQTLGQHFQEIILEQGYQDLTGQLLKRVIGLVSDVEVELVGLVRLAAQVDEITGMVDALDAGEVSVSGWQSLQPEGPQIDADKREDVVSDQSEVDDLLSSLGF